jgi:hypothetical protein
MKFTRRPDLDPHTRIEIVRLAWLYQGVYGKMTQIAQVYQISRTFLYQLLLAATLQLETLFSNEKLLFQKDQQHLDQLLLLLRLEGNCSLLSISSILKALQCPPNSLGSLSQFFHSAGQALPSTLVMPSKKLVFYLSDEIFAIHAPILVTIDAQSTAILTIELASDRSAETWRSHFEALENHHFFSLGMASDRGKGVVAGYQAACDMALWVADYFHEFRDLFEVRYRLERKAYAAINKEYEAARRFAKARSEGNLQKRLQQYDTAHRACEQAITLYDQLDLLLNLLRDALHICSPHGKLRTPAGVRSELTLLLDMIEELDSAAITQTLRRFLKKNILNSGGWCWVDQNVVLGQCRMALQSFFNHLHRRLPERNALLVDFVAELDDRMQPLPGHPLGPLQHGLGIDQLRPIPLQLQETPAPLDWIIFAVVRRIIQELNRLVNVVSELHHVMQKLRPPATALRAIIHFDVQQTRGGLLMCIQGVPLGCEHIHDEVTRFVGAAKGDSQLGTIFIDDATRDIFLLAPHVMITGWVVTPGETTARIIADVHRRFTIDAQAFDAAQGHGLGIFFLYYRRSPRSL